MVDLSIIIVSFNTRDLTIECIRSIVRTVKKNSYEIIVVDNNSEDDSVSEILKLKLANLKLIQNKENVGFSRANNIGVKEARGRFVLFLNTDTVVYENTIDGVVEFMDHNKDAGAATCFVRLPSGRLDDASHRGFPTPWRALSHFSSLSKLFKKSKIFAGYSLGHLDLNKTHEVDALAGAFMLVRREAGEQVRWWDEDFFLYGEDIDFCYRLKEKGWKVMFLPKVSVLHYHGISSGIKKHSSNLSLASEKTRLRALKASTEAMKIF